MPVDYSKNIVYLSKAQYQELLTNQTITVNGTIVTYNDNDIYVTPQEEPYIKPSNGIPASDLAAGVIPSVPVTDVQVNGTSILSQGVANLPIAGTNNNSLGLVKPGGMGININSSNGEIYTNKATSAQIKAGAANFTPIVPSMQHESAFYGLAKAAGADMASVSGAVVGTYPEAQKIAINNMLGSVSKDSLDNAGITGRTYTEKFGGEFTVTTATASGYISPYVRASVTGRINKENMHRVTVNGTEYILPARLWFQGNKVYEYLGNLGLYVTDISGVPGGTDNVSFVIISDLNNSSSIDVLTSTAGTYTIKVEQITNTQTKLPNSLIYGDEYAPITVSRLNGSTFSGISIGVNQLKNKRGTIAIGNSQSIKNEMSTAIGYANEITGASSYIVGYTSTISGNASMAVGAYNNVSGTGSLALGGSNTVSGNNATAINVGNVASGDLSIAMGVRTIANHVGQFAFGLYNVADPSSATSANPGNYIEIVGNGNMNTRSNARTLDWSGNERIAGNVYVNCNADSTGGTMLPTDIQVNGTSIVSNGVANIPVADSDNLGLVCINNASGVAMSSSNKRLFINKATDAETKAGTTDYKPIVASNQHLSTFYGLAKAAGDTTQSASSNAVGTYTTEAKAAIHTMLGIDPASIAAQVDIPLVETVSGTTPTITGQPNVRYVCGEVSTISITPPASGSVDVIFESGSTATTMTVPSTVKWPAWFDAEALEADTTYEILITDGIYGSVMTWAT